MLRQRNFKELRLSAVDSARKLALHYVRIFCAEVEDLMQEGALAVVETYAKYAYKLPDGEAPQNIAQDN